MDASKCADFYRNTGTIYFTIECCNDNWNEESFYGKHGRQDFVRYACAQCQSRRSSWGGATTKEKYEKIHLRQAREAVSKSYASAESLYEQAIRVAKAHENAPGIGPAMVNELKNELLEAQFITNVIGIVEKEDYKTALAMVRSPPQPIALSAMTGSMTERRSECSQGHTLSMTSSFHG